MRLKEEFRRFFSLLADELHYTAQYLGSRRGVLPGSVVQQFYVMGYKSFPIVALITFLVGVTISLTSAAQLRLFGADIYLADLIGLAMIKELVPLMTGIMLAGKVGASITAEISTMKVMDEIDALRTMGIVPEKFLMAPRLIAITLVVPLLVAMADTVGVAGGVLV
ncbi:MAG: ABC transporter permease, partial [Acidobacteria bacterium]|nr:ABC transporter permease [Acidobacteriota bacterium]